MSCGIRVIGRGRCGKNKFMKCRSCEAKIEPFFSLGAMPLVNSFLKKEEIPSEKKYDLTVCFCPNCFLVQLQTVVSPDELFSHYLYFSSVSRSIVEHSQKTAEHLARRLHLTKESLVLEVGSNDGVLLRCFKEQGIQILGVDPARNIAEQANQEGIRTIPAFFNLALASELAEKKGVQADLIYGANVFAHVPEIVDFLNGVKTVLSPRGSAVFEFPYLAGLMEGKFDTIYHEHVFYYSVLALENVCRRTGLALYDIEMLPTQGGSLRVFLSHAGAFPIHELVHERAAKERANGYETIETYQQVSARAEATKEKLLALLNDAKRAGKTVAGYSAPAKGNILLNYFGISNEQLSFIVDKAPAKQGLYTPGTHMLVEHPDVITGRMPDYLLVLCWNIADEVIADMHTFQKGGGKFIIPIPDIKII